MAPDDSPRSPRDPWNEPHGGYNHGRRGQRDGYGRLFDDGPVDEYGRYNPHGPNSYLPGPAAKNYLGWAGAAIGAIALLCAFLGLVFLGSAAGIVAVVCGSMALSQVRRGLIPGEKRTSALWSIAGIALGAIGLVANIVVIAAFAFSGLGIAAS